MSNNLSKHTLGLTQLQSGQGTPTHQAKLGSLYIDVSNADYYKNIDGLSTWDLITGTSGGTNTYVTGTTFSSNQAILSRNDGFDVLKLSGGTNVTLNNPSTNEIVIDVTIPSGINTFVTGFTYDNSNNLTISRNDGVDFGVNIDTMSGLTINGDLLVTGTTNISGLTSINSSLDVYNGTIGLRDNDYFLQGTSTGGTNVQLIGVYSNDEILIGNQGYTNRVMDDTIVDGVVTVSSGLTLSFIPTLNNSGTDILIRNNITGEVEYRPVSGITPDTNTFVTGTTFASNEATLTRNDGFDVLSLSGTNDVTLTNPSTNQIVIDVNGLKYFISETSPTGFTLSNGYRWFNTSIGSEFVYIDDGDSSQWVQPLIQPGPEGPIGPQGPVGPQGPSGFTGTFITTGITTSAATLTTNYTYYGVNYIGDVDLTLPDPTGIDGVNIMIKDEGGNASFNRIRLITSVGLIDGNSSIDMVNNYQSTYIVARNNNWWII